MLEIPFSGIKKIEEIAGSSSEYISLSQGSIKVGGIPQPIKTHIQELLNTDKTDYYESCWGIKSLREAITQYIVERYNPTVTVKQVIPTHGCIGGLSLLFLSLLEPGDEIIIPEPSYPAYSILAQTARCKAVHVSCLKSSDPIQWELSIEKIQQAATAKTKFIIFSNPWNPLGVIVPPSTIKKLINWCEQRGIYLIIDEAYRDFVFEGDFQSALTLINQSEVVISANSFSKNMAMSGWRAGYLVIPEKLAYALAGMQDALLNCLNNVAQHGAMYAIKHPELTKPLHDIVSHNRIRAQQLLQPLIENNILALQSPSGGFFFFLKTTMADASELALDILHNAKVGIVPGSTFGLTGKPFLRLCYARNPEILEEGIKRLTTYFTSRHYSLFCGAVKAND